MESAFGAKPNLSLLDMDYYTFTMMQAILHQHPDTEVVFDVIVRSKESLVHLIPAIRKGIEDLCDLRFRDDELRFLANPTVREYLRPDFVRFLSLFQFNLRYVQVSAENDQLRIRIAGPWLHCIMFEQPVLALVSELRNQALYPDVTLDQVRTRLYQKFDKLVAGASEDELKLLKVADFGTRRRFSAEVHGEVIDIMRKDFPGVFLGTSNVHFGHELDLPVIGTMAHQWLMAFQQFGRLSESQDQALEAWVKEYRGRLGVALTDCISTDFFLSRFDLYFAKLFDGLRQDSGEPMVWYKKVTNHYRKLGIDPKTKTLTFSDGLNFDSAMDIVRAIGTDAVYNFGMGTSLTCDVPGVDALSIVMKLVMVNNQPVVKFSDTPSKLVCIDQGFASYAAGVFNVNMAV